MDPKLKSPDYAPPGYPAVVPSLRVRGALKLFDFVRAVFDAEVVDRTVDDSGTLIYSALRIGTGIVEISEASDRFAPLVSALHVYVPDTVATHRAALEAGGQEIYAPESMDYGELSSGVADPFGNQWYLATGGRQDG